MIWLLVALYVGATLGAGAALFSVWILFRFAARAFAGRPMPKGLVK